MAKKQPKKIFFRYSEGDLLEAVTAVKDGGVSYKKASSTFGIPRSTLMNKCKGRTQMKRKMGPSSVLPPEYEDMLVNWILAMAKAGFPIMKWDLLGSVERLVKEMKLKNTFPNGKPGEKWFKLFIKRHPRIASRVVEKLTHVRASVSEVSLRKWFEECKSYLESEGQYDILKDSTRVFNADETAFMLCPKSEKVLGMKGQRNVYEVTGNSEKESLTVLITCSAAGQLPPPLIVYPYVRLPTEIVRSIPKGWGVGKTESGWMNGEAFYEFMANIFYPWLVEENIVFPVIFFVDGHKSHLTLHLSRFCSEHKIILVALHPNATHLLQPLDVSVFRPMKQGWQREVHNWKMENIREHLTKYNFAPLLKTVVEQKCTSEIIRNGFRICGLFPFDVNVVDFSKCLYDKDANAQTKTNVPAAVQEGETRKIQEGLTFLESYIDCTTLEEFQFAFSQINRQWEGPFSSQDLYDTWKKMKVHLEDMLQKRTDRPRELPEKDSQETEASRTTEIDSASRPPNALEKDIQIDVEQSNCSYTPRNRVAQANGLFGPPVIDAASTSAMEKDIQMDVCLAPSYSLNTPKRRVALAKVLSPETNGVNVPSPFKRVLFWPGTPTKKNKGLRNKEKTPSVVSSTAWQEYMEKKKAEKDKKEKLKLERKNAREAKQATQKSKTKRKTQKESEDWKCNKCLTWYSEEVRDGIPTKWVECDSCKNTFHISCISKTHLRSWDLNLGSDDEDVDFLCEECGVLDDGSDELSD